MVGLEGRGITALPRPHLKKNTRAGRVTATHGPGKATSAPEEGHCVLVGDKHLGHHLHRDEAVIAVIEAHHLLHLEGAFVIKTAIPLAVLAALTNWRGWGIELPIASEQWDWQHGLDLRCFGFRRDQFRHMLAGQRSKNPVFDSGR